MICLILIALLAALWIVGDTRVQVLRCKWQRFIETESSSYVIDANGRMTHRYHFALAIRELSISNASGVVMFSLSEYTSVDADRDALLARWKDHRGWDFSAHSGLARSNPFSIPDRITYSGPEVGGLGLIQASRQGEDATTLRIPILYIMLLLAMSPAVAFHRRRRYLQRLRAGQCLRCGYSMGGVSVCPECGTPADPRSVGK